MVMRVASFFPFQTTYYLDGHSFIEQELNRAQIGFRKNDNAFLAVDDVAALQAAADRLSPEIIRKRLDYWTLILGPIDVAREGHGLPCAPPSRPTRSGYDDCGRRLPPSSGSRRCAGSRFPCSPPECRAPDGRSAPPARAATGR